MKPFFFGSSERQLFGAFHEAAEDAARREAAVLLCYPWLAEYNMTHWAFRKLAASLARDGFPTLRFDYGGTGDSMGATETADVGQWAGDVVSAGKELLELSGLGRLVLVGKGLGATLACEASRALPVRDLVLWDPVVDGGDYLAELDAIDAHQRLLRLYPPPPAPGTADELLGFAVPRAQRTALAAVRLAERAPTLSGALTLVASSPSAAFGRAVDTFKAQGFRAALVEAVEPADEAAAAGQSALLSAKPLAAITQAVQQGERP